jgi:hypothetical protein
MTRGFVIGAASLLLLLGAAPARAHQLDEYVQAAMISVGKDVVRVELRMTPGVKVLPRVLALIDTNGDRVISPAEQRAYVERVLRDVTLAVDGARVPMRLVSSSVASIADMSEGLGAIELGFEAVVPRGGSDRRLTFENHHERAISVYLANALVPEDSSIHIVAQRRSYEQSSFQLDYALTGGSMPAPGTNAGELAGYAGMVSLGMRHIADGTDHLLFLLVLLLPAPLVAVAGRWGGYAGARRGVTRLLRIVTAFTVCHSLTLALGATGLVRAPSAIVEVLVAVSILVSAVHAVRPIFPGREAFVAAGFGLVHGLAFATTIAGLGIDAWHTALTVLGFNIGIELMQLAIVAVTVPWLFALARTPAHGWLRLGGAVVAGVAALGWIGERALGLANPFGPIVEAAAQHGRLIVAALALLALATSKRTRGQTPMSVAASGMGSDPIFRSLRSDGV